MSTETKAELELLYNQSIKVLKEGQVVSGKIVEIKTKEVLVDVGFKSEGIVPIAEFSSQDLEIGKEMEFLLETMENDAGVMTLSREKAMRMQGWDKIVKLSNDGTLVEGKPVKKVKGGFLVDIMGIEGFLPSSLSSFRNIADKDILYKIFKFKIVKVNNLRRSIIVSRREAV
ncbi:MAG: S1 RNA-binding domain-containing protein, partial [Candidatus Omnitrophica bacterium]|nr:S1 RNA-binding domain-containing protein [Candidatus Omnitrophota bacterium]